MQTVLHVPFTFFPDPCGGTEVYVDALARTLNKYGLRNVIAAPAGRSASYRHDGLSVRRFAVDSRVRLAAAYNAPDEFAAENFRKVLKEVRPSIVHLHAHTSAVSTRLIDVARAACAKVVFTYHTPTASCARGTMMQLGEKPCDGLVERRRCIACAIDGSGAPRSLARLAATLPESVTSRLADLPFESGTISHLRTPGLIARRGAWFKTMAYKADAVVAVCSWVRSLLERNGVSPSRITLSRQGISAPVERSLEHVRSGGYPLRIVYFGRLEWVKGIDLLVGALQRRPDAEILLDIYAVDQSEGAGAAAALSNLTSADQRVRVRAPVTPQEVLGVITGYDFVAVPSRWQETGPLVVLEAFAAGVPVIGSSLGGIAELVRNDVDGILLPPNDVNAWTDIFDRLLQNPGIAEYLRSNIRPPRTMNDVAEDMVNLYGRLLRQ